MASMKRRSVLTYMSVRFSILATAAWPTCSVCASSSCESRSARRSSAKSISRLSVSAFASARARASGDIFARSSENECLPAICGLLPQFLQVLVIEPIGDRDELFVEPLVTGLVAANEQDRSPPRIERIEDAQRPAAALYPQFAHMRMTRSHDPARVRKRQCRTPALQLLNDRGNILLLSLHERIPPDAELVGVLDDIVLLRNTIPPWAFVQEAENLTANNFCTMNVPSNKSRTSWN